MSFHRPLLLCLLVLPALWAAWRYACAGIPLLLPVDHSKGNDGRWLRRFTTLAECAPALLLACAILFLSGPRRPAPPRDQRILNNITLLVDVSGSMEETVPGGKTRFETAMSCARAFCSRREGDAFGLSIFGGDLLHWFPPTKDLSALRNATHFIRPRDLPPWFAGTLIARALEGCVPRLASTTEGDRALILLTDGESADFDGSTERQVAEKLKAARIKVFSVVIGEDPTEGLYHIAAQTGGKVFRADDPKTLTDVFNEIDSLQPSEFRQIVSDWVDWYQPVCLAGLTALAGVCVHLLGLRFTPW
jgi:Ca-activated chloride channel family protein